MKTKFLPIDYDYFDFEGKNYIKITGRDEKNKRICVIDSCDVYFWVILNEKANKKNTSELIKKIKKIKVKTADRITPVTKIEEKEKKFLDKDVKALQIFADNYKDLHSIADHLGDKIIFKRRGYDLGFITHYIIEKKLNPLEWHEIEGEILDGTNQFGGISEVLDVEKTLFVKQIQKTKGPNFSPKILCYDIETDALKIGEGQILMISLVSDNFKKVITHKKIHSPHEYVETVKNEKELLQKFIEYTKKISPDFLVGYFSDGFDLPYLKARAQKNKIKLELGLDRSQPILSRGIMTTAKIKGITHIDLLRFIRTAYSQYMKSETLSLDDVSKEFLGDTKKPFVHRHSSQIKTPEEWNEYFEYNLHDSNLVKNLFEKFWPDMIEFSKTVREPLFDVTRAGLSKIVEGYILHNLEKYNEIPEKKPTGEELSFRRRMGPVEGAFVLEPSPGLYEKIAMFDFTSMHTSIIISMNISKGTLLTKKEKNSNTIKSKLGEFSFTKKKGFLPSMLEEIFKLRINAKEEYKKNPNTITKAKSNAFKVLSASVHGYIAFFGARYYSKESSSSILAYVRKFNMDTIKKIEKLGHKVIYGDTDSIAFLMQNKNKKQIKELLEKLNKELPGIMRLELEDFYKRGIWVTTRSGKTGAKKKYALLDEENNLKIRGFETVRRDWCKLARNVQNTIIKMILENGNEKKALGSLKKIIKKIKNREVNLSELIIKTQLKKPISEYKSISPHVIAAKKLKEAGEDASIGSLISYYVAEPKNKKEKLVRERVKLENEPGNYDIKYYLQNQIIPAAENIFQVFKIDLKEIIEGKKQTTLGDF